MYAIRSYYGTGQFLRIESDPLAGLPLEEGKWLCYPAQVGPVVVFVYFHSYNFV